MSRSNHPFVVWAACFLWLASMFAITWSLLLFISIGDMLVITGTDLVNAVVLLLGIVMLPTNVHMLYNIAHGQKINHNAKVLCCPLWMCIMWIVVISCVGVALCAQRIHLCKHTSTTAVSHSMENYRRIPKYKNFVDNLQWSLKCCGVNSFQDWFKQDWYDNIRDNEWDPSTKHKRNNVKHESVADSVPLSCCKSGSCVSNFLLELGTHSIHTKGCSPSMYRILMISMNAHLIAFIMIIITELTLLKYITNDEEVSVCAEKQIPILVTHIKPLNKFADFSESSSCNPDDSDDLEADLN